MCSFSLNAKVEYFLSVSVIPYIYILWYFCYAVIFLFSFQLNIVYSGLLKEIIDLDQSLLTAENTINEVNEYVISFENNGLMDIDVEELYQNIEAINTTIKQLEAEANSSYKMLEEYQESIQYMLSVIESLKQNISVAGSDILNATNTSNIALSLAEMTRSVSTEISSINTALKSAEKKAIDLEEGITNSNTDIDLLTADFEELNLTLVNLNSQLAVVFSLSESLKISTEVAKNKADASMDAVKILMVSCSISCHRSINLLLIYYRKLQTKPSMKLNHLCLK